ncbi:MAG: HAD hydrolase-like protein [Opitutales bacterium]
MSPRKLLLWDLDETLVSTDGAGERAFERAAKSAFGVEIGLSDVDYSGRTDPLIGILIQRHFGLPENDGKLHDFLADFINFLPDELPRGNPRVLPGVESLTSAVLHDDAFAQGLLTGNLAAGAEIKLRYFGLWERFPFGAFADDARERNHLGPIALERAATLCSTTFAPKEITVIGDTGRDVTCAQVFGARSLAVASGKCSVDELSLSGADCVVKSLEDAAAIDFLGLTA